MPSYDAIIVGSGPNGLTAACLLAKAGLRVHVVEAKETIGGGTRTMELTLPGYRHDVCSAIHPMGISSPAFAQLELESYGIEWIHSPLALAHPLADGSAAVLSRDMDVTRRSLGVDGDAWRDLMEPFVERFDALLSDVLRPIRMPRNPMLMLRFAASALRSCDAVIRSRFKGPHAASLFAGCAAHSSLPLDAFASSSFGMMLALVGHAVGWPIARGGSSSISEALARHLVAHGGTIETGLDVKSLGDLPAARAIVFDLTPRQIARIAGDALPDGYRRRFERYRHGPGTFKVDWALAAPIPWTSEECRRAATVHVGPTHEEIARCEAGVNNGRIPERPFVLVAQQSLFDATRAPEGRHAGWAYCHVPHGSTADMTTRIEAQVERFAPGFRDLILERHVIGAMDFEAYNANMIGGDIGGGANDVMQILMRPVARFNPYTTPNRKLFICSSSTPPGGGVHGMCGYWSAREVLRRLR